MYNIHHTQRTLYLKYLLGYKKEISIHTDLFSKEILKK